MIVITCLWIADRSQRGVVKDQVTHGFLHKYAVLSWKRYKIAMQLRRTTNRKSRGLSNGVRHTSDLRP